MWLESGELQRRIVARARQQSDDVLDEDLARQAFGAHDMGQALRTVADRAKELDKYLSTCELNRSRWLGAMAYALSPRGRRLCTSGRLAAPPSSCRWFYRRSR